MRRLRTIAWMATAVIVAACSGGARTIIGTPSSGGGTTSDPVATLTVTASTATIAADGSTSATITAVAKDANNNFVTGAAVAFTSTAGGLAVSTPATTNASGQVTATLTAGTAASGTVITVTASSQGKSGTATVTVGTIQQTITLITSSPTIPSDSSTAATITALVRNAQNQFVSGVPVNFTANSNGGLVITTPTTNANGAAAATLNAAGDPTPRSITVTATAGTTTATVIVQVSGTSLKIAGPANLVQGSPGTYTVSLTDSGGNPIAGQAVKLTSALGNTLSPASLTTTAGGSAATFTMTAVKGGTDSITASALGVTATYAVSISTQTFAFTAPASPANVNLSPVTATVTVNWQSNGSPVTNSPVSFQATRGTLSATSATTDGSGNASVTISSTIAGPSVISATATAATGTVVTAQTSVDFIATDPTAIVLQASPSTIAVKGSSGTIPTSSTITATVRDPTNNLVEGQVVNFAITQDSTGGTLSVASATTDANGQATTTYSASTTTSATNGIVISGTVASNPTATATTSLTVGGQTVFLSLGTGNTLSPLNSTQYSQPWSVQAVDAAGNGVNNIPIVFSVTSLGYGKGSNVWSGTEWVPQYNTLVSDPDAYVLNGLPGCQTEDKLGNGILEPGEDYNSNGKLDPGLVANTDVATATTANGGSASFNLIYPKDHAYWVAVRLTATATVSGTQSSSSAVFWLLGLASDYTSQTVEPPGLNSPYGIASPGLKVCSNPN